MSTTPYSLGWSHGRSGMLRKPAPGVEGQYNRGYDDGVQERDTARGTVVFPGTVFVTAKGANG